MAILRRVIFCSVKAYLTFSSSNEIKRLSASHLWPHSLATALVITYPSKITKKYLGTLSPGRKFWTKMNNVQIVYACEHFNFGLFPSYFLHRAYYR